MLMYVIIDLKTLQVTTRYMWSNKYLRSAMFLKLMVWYLIFTF